MSPFSPDYVPQLKLGSNKFKRPKLTQPPVNARAQLVPKSDIPRFEHTKRISQTQI